MRCIVIFLALLFSLETAALELKSDNFKSGAYIPPKCAYDSSNIHPSLSWTDVPQGTESFAIICDDPDSYPKTWVHWVIFNIPKNVKNISQSTGAIEGINDFGKTGYAGPCPPPGKPHRYYFKLYALDTMLNLKKGAAKENVLRAMEGHILAETEILGIYKR